MKVSLILLTLLFPLLVSAQSYLILSNGVTLTVDKSGFIYDFDHFFLPYKVQVNGGQFFVSDEILYTIDENGFLYKKDTEIDPKDVVGKGLNYFINDSHHLYTIDQKGFVFKYSKDKSVIKKAKLFGGNFFTVELDEKKKITELYTLNSKGNFFKTVLQGLNPYEISTVGGRWFLTNKNVLYTISKDGFVFSKNEVIISKVKINGGNYLVDDTNKMFTISDDGLILLPNLPITLNLNQINKIGSNYLIDKEGRAFVINSSGEVLERSTQNHDLRAVKIISTKSSLAQ